MFSVFFFGYAFILSKWITILAIPDQVDQFYSVAVQENLLGWFSCLEGKLPAEQRVSIVLWLDK